ncbi:hypothetical protein CJ030_MR7G016688 [Morella rubra]|uniref:Uncharacterized protein n=1 Tax=Morella rubra TaxID=262757 RepID=A0A6A1UX66_9ROSI|nr:hypothetical protein CJ030_MR7G016688 [Morella rubra]
MNDESIDYAKEVWPNALQELRFYSIVLCMVQQMCRKNTYSSERKCKHLQ